MNVCGKLMLAIAYYSVTLHSEFVLVTITRRK
jgi:hypothetical protein